MDCARIGREKNPEKEGTLPQGKTAEEILTGILKKKPSACSEEEKEQFALFVELGLASLNKRLLVQNPEGARQAYKELTESDVAWAITNFTYYAGKDEPLENSEERKRTKKGNDSVRKHKRRKITKKKDREQIGVLYSDIKKKWMKWEHATDIKDDKEESDRMYNKRREIREEWAQFWASMRVKSDREDVQPSNGGEAKGNPYAGVKLAWPLPSSRRE